MGVVKHQQITAVQQVGQLVKDAIDQGLAAAIEQARGAALGAGVLGDELRGQLEIKITQGKALGRHKAKKA